MASRILEQLGIHSKWLFPNCHENFASWQILQEQSISPVLRYISSAEEFYRYMEYMSNKSRKEAAESHFHLPSTSRLGQTPRVLPECGHKLHPSAKPEAFCPVCKVAHHIAFLDAIAFHWRNVGGPFRENYEEMVPLTEAYCELKTAWRKVRLHLIKLVAQLEAEAEAEMDLEGAQLYTAAVALKKYHETYTYPVSEPLDPLNDKRALEMGKQPKSRGLGKQERSIRFKEEVVDSNKQIHEFAPKARHQRCFSRSQLRSYKPGRHAAREGHELVDTSFMSDLKIALEQCKFFVTQEPSLVGYSQTPAAWPEFLGVLGEHKERKDILKRLEELFAKPGAASPKQFLDSLNGADGIALISDGQALKDVIVLKAAVEMHKKDINQAQERRCSWVSLEGCAR